MSLAALALFHAAFGALAIVAMSCIAAISGRMEERLNRKQRDGSSFLKKIERAGISTAGISRQLYYNDADKRLIERLRGAAMRWAVCYLALLGLSMFLIMSRWNGAPTDDWIPLLAPLGFTLLLVLETWLAFSAHLASVSESVSKAP